MKILLKLKLSGNVIIKLYLGFEAIYTTENFHCIFTVYFFKYLHEF